MFQSGLVFFCLACVVGKGRRLSVLQTAQHVDPSSGQVSRARGAAERDPVVAFALSGAKLPSRRHRYGAPVLSTSGIATAEELETSSAIGDEYRKQHQIILKQVGKKGNQTGGYDPIGTFAAAPFHPAMKAIFEEQGYEKPFPIQAQTWPIMLEERDVISIGKSGSGKTIAFLAPLFHKMMERAIDQEATAAEEEEEESSPVIDTAMIGTRVAIPYNLVPAFQGKKGENFKKLKKRADVLSIEIEDEEDLYWNDDRSIIIKGMKSNVHAVKKELLNAFSYTARPTILVLAPTRELVIQIQEEAEKYTRAAGVRSIRLIGGGSSKDQQIFLLRTIRPEIIVATPGRCKELEEIGEIDLSAVKYLVLDEADRMLELGFEKEMRHLNRRIKWSGQEKGKGDMPAQGTSGANIFQVAMFSATWPERVRTFADFFLKSPVISMIGEDINKGGGLKANEAIVQHVKVMPKSEKNNSLWSLLEDLNPDEEKNPVAIPKILIFAALKGSTISLAEEMREKGYRADRLHSGMQQHDRTKVLGRFRRGELSALVTTELAARGLDMPDIDAVINYDMPRGKQAHEFYVHRIGRTARGNRTGVAYTFFTKEDKQTAFKLVKVLKEAKQEVPEELAKIAAKDPKARWRREQDA